MIKVKDKHFEKFISHGEIIKKVRIIGDKINEDYKDKMPLFIPILNGAFIFAADLIQQINIPTQLSFIKFSSYKGASTTGSVKHLIGLNENIENMDIIIIEDIVDTGITIDMILTEFNKLKPRSIEIATLLLKPDALQKKVDIKYSGFEIPDKFVVGYGLDYDGYGRNFKDIYQVVEKK